jgi:hypothetical protein
MKEARRIGHVVREVQLLTAFSETYLLAGRISEATRSGQEALRRSRAFGMRFTEAQTLLTLGDIRAVATPPPGDDAEAPHAEAIALAAELGMRPLPPRPRQAPPARGRPPAGPGAPHHRRGDVPRHGHAVLAGAGGGGAHGARVSHEDAPRAPRHATRGCSRGRHSDALSSPGLPMAPRRFSERNEVASPYHPTGSVTRSGKKGGPERQGVSGHLILSHPGQSS